MLGAARGDAVGKFGKARAAHEMHVLHLDIAGRQALAFEQNVDPAVAPVFDLAPQVRIGGKFREVAGPDRLGDDGVGMGGVDAGIFGAAPEIGFHDFPGIFELAGGIVGM